MPSSLVIVGASLAGLRCAEALRKRGYDGRLWLVGEEAHAPYDRPPLSKQLLTGEWEPSRVFFRQREGFDDLRLDMLLGRRAVALDPRARTVALSGGGSLEYDGLVIATGATPRRLAAAGTSATADGARADLAGVHVLRTLDDAQALRAALLQRPRVLVVGAGFIGLEVASSARKLGLEVTVVEAELSPLARNFHPVVGQSIRDLHAAHGVVLRTGVTVQAIEGHERVERVALSDGSRLEVDAIVVGIGVVPETAWLVGSGVALGNGVICDAGCATNLPGVVAAGDVACQPNALYGESLRLEHWANAIEQAQIAAGTLLGDTAPPRPLGQVPYFWTDQYDRKLQCAGRISPEDTLVLVEGALGDPSYVALFGRAGRLRGVLASNRPTALIRYRRLLAERVTFDAAIAAAASPSP